ncbi:MAG: hypothetical protein WCQ87_07020, partial [Parabacteroides sp.]
MKALLLIGIALFMTGPISATNGTDGNNAILYQNNRYPLVQKPYVELPIGSIHPDGWMKVQFE